MVNPKNSQKNKRLLIIISLHSSLESDVEQSYSILTRKTILFYPLLSLGVVSMGTQILLLRTLLDVFYGNELILGIFFTNWMLLTGVGAAAARMTKGFQPAPRQISTIFLLFGFLPVLTSILITIGRIWFFPSGTIPGFTTIYLFILLLQSPFCLLSGWLFPSLISLLDHEDEYTVSRAYSWESWGSFAGSLLVAVLLLYLPSVVLYFLMFLVSFLQAWLITRKSQDKKAAPLLFAGLLISLTALLFLSPQRLTKQLFFKGQQVIFQQESPYGDLVITQSEGQTNLYENGLPLFSGNDAISREESVHFAMLQHPKPERVLLISGGLSGVLDEIKKYPVKEVDYLEINPLIIDAGNKFGMIPQDPRIRCIKEDARLWLKKSKTRFDVILILVPDPVTAQLNRYFTYEFFRELHHNLSSGSIVSISLRSTTDYINPISKTTNSLIYNSLYYNYKNVLLVPGGRNYFLASNRDLSLNLDSLVKQKNIHTVYVNGDYFPNDLLKQRSEFLDKQLIKSNLLNRDFHPRAYLEETRLWLTAFKTPWWVFTILAALMTVIYLIRTKKPGISLFVTGFSASSLSFLLMIAFQALFGYVYLMAGVLISLFMLGLFAGSHTHTLIREKGYTTLPAWNQILMGGFAIVVLLFLLGNKSLTSSSTVLMILFMVMSLLTGLLTGIQFSAVSVRSEYQPSQTASSIYSADLAGSALGMLITSSFLFPMAGLVWVCLVLAGINFIIGFLMFD